MDLEIREDPIIVIPTPVYHDLLGISVCDHVQAIWGWEPQPDHTMSR